MEAGGGGRQLVMRTSPPNATVVISRLDGTKVAEVKGGQTIELPAGSYSWSAAAPGHVGTASRAGAIALDRSTRVELSVVLQPAAVDGDYRAADAAFKEDNAAGCARAIDLYGRIPRPADLEDQEGVRWLESRLRMAQCAAASDPPDWGTAEAQYRLVVDASPTDWLPRYRLGRVLCDIGGDGDFRRGRAEFTRLRRAEGMSYAHTTGARLLALFGEIYCDHAEWERKGRSVRYETLRDRIAGSLEEFIPEAERFLRESGNPRLADLRREVQEARKEAADIQRQVDRS